VSIANYSQLKSTVADWLNRGDLTAVIPAFINLAESRFNRDLRVRQMIQRAEATTDSGDNYVTLPGDWLEARSVKASVNGQMVSLQYLTLEAVDRVQRDRAYAGGQAQYFTVIGNRLELIPTPPTGTDVEMLYYGKIPALSDQNTSNWLLETWPDMYLYGTLAHTAPYLKDDERLSVWAALYDRALDEIRLSDDRAQHSSFNLRMRARTLG
jgi:hypothetical protein